MSKRKSRRWPPRIRKRAIKRFKVNRTYLHEAEEAFILADIASFEGAPVSPADLERKFPGRYDPVYLPRVLKRMSAPFGIGPRKLERTRGGGWHVRTFFYSLPKPREEREAKAA